MRIHALLLMLAALPAFSFPTRAQTKIAVGEIRKIILETGDGFCFDCERITILRAAGEDASFHGGKNSRLRAGDFSGKFAAKDFARLAGIFIKNGFFDLKPRYDGNTSDVATIKITVVSADGSSKTVENFKRSGESRLKIIERDFDAAAGKIIWRKQLKS